MLTNQSRNLCNRPKNWKKSKLSIREFSFGRKRKRIFGKREVFILRMQGKLRHAKISDLIRIDSKYLVMQKSIIFLSLLLSLPKTSQSATCIFWNSSSGTLLASRQSPTPLTTSSCSTPTTPVPTASSRYSSTRTLNCSGALRTSCRPTTRINLPSFTPTCISVSPSLRSNRILWSFSTSFSGRSSSTRGVPSLQRDFQWKCRQYLSPYTDRSTPETGSHIGLGTYNRQALQASE